MLAKRVVILGATGSIGDSTLDILTQHPDKFRLYAVSGHRNLARLLTICAQFNPEFAIVTSTVDLSALRNELKARQCRTEVLQGNQALEALASDAAVDIVVAAIVGAAGLKPTLAAVNAGKRILLANKEALVMTGQLFMSAVRRTSADLLPVDSEHNAIYQCLPPLAQNLCEHASLESHGVTGLLLTASGGPFRTTPISEMSTVTPAQACKHPNWSMGRKISVDSASLMNKGLELIEACWLFGLKAEQVKVHIHPESIVHSLVTYRDGSILAQLGNPDMRTPIAYGLAWPERIDSGVGVLDLLAAGQLNFLPPDRERFPCLTLAEEAFRIGGTAPAFLNAANEVAVEAFLQKRIKFTDIPVLIAETLSALSATQANSLECVFAADHDARNFAGNWLRTMEN